MEKCYLLHVRIGGQPSKSRIAEAAKEIQSLVKEMSPDHQLAYTSSDGGTFAFLIKTSLPPSIVVERINSPGSDERDAPVIPSPLQHGDSLLVMEIGESLACMGNTRVQNWVYAHCPRTNRPGERKQVASDAPKEPSKLASQLDAIKGKLRR